MGTKMGLVLASLVFAGCGPATMAPAPADGNAQQNTPGLTWVADSAGAWPTADGARFRVWAPNADKVFVMGSFDGWDKTGTQLTREPSGYFSGTVVNARAGDEYMYRIVHGGEAFTRADPRAREMTNSAGHSVIVDPNAYAWKSNDYKTPSWDDLVIYEMHVGTFNDQPGGAPGTFAGATDKLDHVEKLGANAIELMPPSEFAGDFSWGYNTAYPFAPESAYGKPEDLKHFIDEAHARGIAVLIDVVHNHYGPSDLSMWCFDGDCLGKDNGGAYFYTDWRRESGWGPRPDFGRQAVRDFVVDSAETWLEEYRADGLRWDSTVNIRSANGSDIQDGWGTLMRANDTVDQRQSWKLMVAEDLANDEWLTKPTASGGAGFDSQWDAAFFHPVDDNIIAADDSARNMWQIRDAISHNYNGDGLQRVIYTESHDEVANGKERIPEMIWPGNASSYFSKKRSTLGAAIVLTSPGIPMMFQGQEFLEDGYFQDGVPLDWSKVDKFSGIFRMYRDLVALRHGGQGTTRGLRGRNVNVFQVNDSAKVIAFHRWDQGGPGDDVVIVANFSGKAFPQYEIGFPRGGAWNVRFNGDWQGYDSSFDGTPSNAVDAFASPKDGLAYRGSVGVGPYSVVILSQ
jgi:malto-oligosyltrehalose trehalohydrolase